MKAEPTLGRDVRELVDVDELRREVKEKYREVASNPHELISCPTVSTQSACDALFRLSGCHSL
jgi:hypothetical protein